jgi:YesN/AraC family two-component response regulator
MYTILVADDEQIERKVLIKNIQKGLSGEYSLLEANNGKKAIEWAEKEKIDIAIMDIEMPGINGLIASKEIKKRYPDCCIIFLTAYDAFEYARDAVSLRALDYLLKPYAPQDVLNVLDKAKQEVDHLKEIRRLECHDKCFELDEEAIKASKMGQIAKDIETYVKQNYKKDLSLQEVAAKTNYSEAYFCKLFKEFFHTNFTSYLTHIRIQEAKRLLEDPTINIKEIAQEVGYNDSNYFCKVFRREQGKTPSQYRAEIFTISNQS